MVYDKKKYLQNLNCFRDLDLSFNKKYMNISKYSNNMLPFSRRILKVTKETSAEYTFRIGYEGQVAHDRFFQLSIPKFGEAPISASGKGRDLVVITGGTGMAPVKTLLHYFAQHSDEAGEVYFIAGFKDIKGALFKEEREQFQKSFHTIYTLDKMDAPGFRKGFVTEYLDQIPFAKLQDCNVIVVGSPPIMRAVAEKCKTSGVCDERIWMSFERKMSCAVGRCGHCKINEKYVCLDGPVFNYTIAKKCLINEIVSSL